MNTENKNMKKLIIMRGCPGSGKSYVANLLRNGYIQLGFSCSIYSTDNFFIKDGVYKFDPTKIGVYHRRNTRRVFDAMQDQVDVIIVDNTNTVWKEVKKYCALALAHDYEVVFMEPETPWKSDINELVTRNTHGVPRESIQKMLDRYEDQKSMDLKFSLLKLSYGDK